MIIFISNKLMRLGNGYSITFRLSKLSYNNHCIVILSVNTENFIKSTFFLNQ